MCFALKSGASFACSFLLSQLCMHALDRLVICWFENIPTKQKTAHNKLNIHICYNAVSILIVLLLSRVPGIPLVLQQVIIPLTLPSTTVKSCTFIAHFIVIYVRTITIIIIIIINTVSTHHVLILHIDITTTTHLSSW